MKHMIQARNGALSAMQKALRAGLAEKMCLIVDLQGRLRVLAKIADAQAPNPLEQTLAPEMANNCENYWAKEIWFDRERSHPMGRVNPPEAALFAKIWQEAKPEPRGQTATFTLDRRYSKEAWFAADIQPVWEIQGPMPPIVSFYSYKGGVGRTTALAALAIQCARAGKRVLVMDFDFEAPGIGSVLPASGAAPEVGVLDYLIEFPVVGNAFDPAEALYTFDTPEVIKGREPIMVVPAGRVDDWYLEKLGRLNLHSLSESLEPRAIQDSGLKPLFFKLREQTKADLILVDSRAGLHDLGGLTLCGLAHWHVLFGLDSDQSWLGIRVAISRLGKEQILGNRTQRDCLLVQSMVPPQNGKEEAIERFRLKAFDVFRDEYYNDPGDANAEWPLPDPQSSEEPHFPVPLLYDNRVMGYRSLAGIADYLCEGDFKQFGAALLLKAGITL
jgi:hypothetical protein